MEFCDNKCRGDYNNGRWGNSCLSAAYYFNYSFEAHTAFCPVPLKRMENFDESLELQIQVWQILCTILPTIFWFAMARVVTQECEQIIKGNSTLRYLIEFVLITLPTIFGINMANNYVQFIVALMSLSVIYLVWQTGCIQMAKERSYFIGARPDMLTLSRATINFLTTFCILSIDFETFPKSFRKTRYYGAGLMDTGIGLFVFAMGTVSKRPRRPSDLKKMLRIVIPLLVLGIIRTVVIMAIGYNQDEHEYGIHLNAFFTLGFTKLLGTLVSFIARKDAHLLPLGIVVMIIHEITLQLGIDEFAMNRYLGRDDFLTANREGLCSLPGFVGMYIISMHLGYTWQTANVTLTYKEFMAKMKSIFFICFAFWVIATVCVWTIGIARVICNVGYAAWVLGIGSVVTLIFMFIFHIVLNTLWPINEANLCPNTDGGEGASLLKSSSSSYVWSSKFALPMMVEAVNMNGLVFFLVANILTGSVNIFLTPKERSNFEGYFILFIYILLATGLVFILFKRKIRIG